MAEGSIACAQYALAQHAAVGMHEREGGIVANGADIAQMVRQTLQFGHERSQPGRAWRSLDTKRGFDRAGKSKRIRHGAVAGRPACKLGGTIDGGPRHQALYALVHISETLLQPDNRFAARRKSKMPRLDDAGMHGPHRDLMQALTLGGQETVGATDAGAGTAAPNG